MKFRNSLATFLCFGTFIVGNGALAQSVDYFTEFEDGSVFAEVGRVVASKGCKLTGDEFVDVVTQAIVDSGFETEMSASDFSQVILMNLQIRNQIGTDGETLVFNAIEDCLE